MTHFLMSKVDLEPADLIISKNADYQDVDVCRSAFVQIEPLASGLGSGRTPVSEANPTIQQCSDSEASVDMVSFEGRKFSSDGIDNRTMGGSSAQCAVRPAVMKLNTTTPKHNAPTGRSNATFVKSTNPSMKSKSHTPAVKSNTAAVKSNNTVVKLNVPNVKPDTPVVV